MTYCVGLMVDDGMVLLSDTRTNAGFDNISTYKKMFTFEDPGKRIIVILTAGSLSVTQTVIAKLEEATESGPENKYSVFGPSTTLQVAEMIGALLSEVSINFQAKLNGMAQSASASLIVAGQSAGGKQRLFLIYPEGNFIEATSDTPFLQIGEHKYGKPILDRVIQRSTSLRDARKAALLSMDSTLRSNLSVGMPLDLAIIENNQFSFKEQTRIEAGDPEFLAMSEAWSEALRDSFTSMPISNDPS
jgi:putative proteasome-type protease